MKQSLLIFLLLATGFTAPVEGMDTEVRMYALRYREASETIRLVEPLLSPLGAVSYYAPTHSIVVNDVAYVHERVKEALRTFDVNAVRYMIEVFRIQDSGLSRISRNIAWTSVGGGWGAGIFEAVGAQTEMRVNLSRWVEKAQRTGNGPARAMGYEGQEADLWIGRVPSSHEAPLRDYLQRFSGMDSADDFGTMTTGFSWSVGSGDRSVLSVSPRILRVAADRTNIQDVPGHTARYEVVLGDWFVLSAGGKGSALLDLLYGVGGPGDGFNLLVRITREGA